MSIIGQSGVQKWTVRKKRGRARKCWRPTLAIKRAASRGFFLTTEKAARGEADGLEREGCGEGDGLLASVGRGGRLWVLAMQAMRGRAGALAGMRRAVPSAVAEAPPSWLSVV